MSQTAKQITFAGRVGGIKFRVALLDAAQRHGLTGHARSTGGGVEMVAQGDPQAIKRCLAEIRETHKTGITKTRVKAVALTDELKDFKFILE